MSGPEKRVASLICCAACAPIEKAWREANAEVAGLKSSLYAAESRAVAAEAEAATHRAMFEAMRENQNAAVAREGEALAEVARVKARLEKASAFDFGRNVWVTRDENGVWRAYNEWGTCGAIPLKAGTFEEAWAAAESAAQATKQGGHE